MSDLDNRCIRRCLELGRMGGRDVRPNPYVGSILVFNGAEVSSGFHQRYGGAHAEVNSINNLMDRTILSESTLYVNLEPCAHFGKTPPCAGRIIEEGIREVVFGGLDPNPEVAGKGMRILKEAGVVVRFGRLLEECVELNKRFYTAHLFKRPYVILKWAETQDRFIARVDGSSRWISSVESRTLTHTWRSEEDAVLVGTETASIDDPALTVRHVEGRNPLRVVLDLNLRLSETLKLFDGSADTLRFSAKVPSKQSEAQSKVRTESIDPSTPLLPQMLGRLLEIGVQSVIVEGGSKTLNSFISSGLWDEMRIFSSKEKFGEGISAPDLSMLTTGYDPKHSPDLQVECLAESQIGSDTLKLLLNKTNRSKLLDAAGGLSQIK